MEADSVQDFEALADVLLLWDQRDKTSAEESARERRTGPQVSTRWRNGTRNGAPNGVLDGVLDDAQE